MKILFINTIKLEKNGITTFILNNAKYLAQEKYNVSILAPNKIDCELEKILEQNNITLFTLNNRKRNPLRYIKDLSKIINNNNFDVIHVNGNSSTMTLELFAAKLAGCKCRISHSHNTVTEHIFIHRLLYPLFNLLTTDRMACSDAAGKWLYQNKQFFVIKNGVDINNYIPTSEIRTKLRKKLNLKSSDILLGNIGYFNLQKNQKFLIPIMQKLDKKFKLILIGDGLLKEEVQSLVEQNNLQSRIIFAGNINNVNEYLSALDIFLMPSKFEGLPFALVEAQASGLPCIISNKISHEADLTGNVQFLSLSDSDKWINIIQTTATSYSFKKRLSIMDKVHKKIKINGYDAEQNAHHLGEIFKLVSKKVSINNSLH